MAMVFCVCILYVPFGAFGIENLSIAGLSKGMVVETMSCLAVSLLKRTISFESCWSIFPIFDFPVNSTQFHLLVMMIDRKSVV